MHKSIVFLACSCMAQTAGLPTFEVASVKVAPPRDRGASKIRGGPGTENPGHLYATSSSLSGLIMRAYGLKRYQFSCPTWMDAALYDLAATLPGGATKHEANLMLQQLLLERFQLRARRETRELRVYELRVGTGGLKISPVSEDSPSLAMPEIKKKEWGDDFPEIPSEVLRAGVIRLFSGDRARLFVRKQSMQQFADLLFTGNGAAGTLDRPVLDRTGAAGIYSFNLSWTIPARPSPAANPDSDPDLGVPLITAIRQQLGLKLESGKAMIDIFVVDGARKVPIEN